MPDLEHNSNSVDMFDEKNPANTLAQLAGIDENEANEIIRDLSLTDYVAIVNAIQNKDLSQLTDIIDKNIDKSHNVEEALDVKTKDDLQKMADTMPKSSIKPVQNTSTTPSSTPSLTPQPTSSMTPVSGANTPQAQQGGQTSNSNQNKPDNIVSVDPTSGTIAVKDPSNPSKVIIKSIKDPKQTSDIADLMKNAGITGV